MDIIYLNWIEDISERRFGYVQNIFLFIFIPIFKLFNKKIIWIMHNKISHSKKNRFLKIINFYFLVNYADIVITHSKEGIRFAKSFMKIERTIHFKHHPLDLLSTNFLTKEKKYDLLIWGTITPYKGIVEFLEGCEKSILPYYRICIAGKINNETLQLKIRSYESKNITILDQFISNDTLDMLLVQSKIVLFTYSGYSTLSSGALMHSLERECKIIGPNVGAFLDLEEENIIKTYKNFDELPILIERILKEDENNKNVINEFFHENTWEKYGKFISKLLKTDL
jgi:glycosyltransferase involved in cell wall biosynthesis